MKGAKAPEKVKLERLACVSAYIDGWRDVVILSHGHVWLRGFEAATLSHVALPADAPVKPLPYPLPRLARRLRRNAKTYAVTGTVKAAINEMSMKAKEVPAS